MKSKTCFLDLSSFYVEIWPFPLGVKLQVVSQICQGIRLHSQQLLGNGDFFLSKVCRKSLTPLKFTIAPEKLMVGNNFSFGMANFQSYV